MPIKKTQILYLSVADFLIQINCAPSYFPQTRDAFVTNFTNTFTGFL